MAPKLIVVGATGWYGKSFVSEYVTVYGCKAAADNLLLFASKPSVLVIEDKHLNCALPVAALTELTHRSFNEYAGLVWYAFVLKNKLNLIGNIAYKAANDAIANQVFACLAANRHLRTAFFSSGVAHGVSDCPQYSIDPYVHLKIIYERRLRKLVPLVTFYPYATLGIFVPDHRVFAVASFIYQALKIGRITINSPNIVVRSYGSVHDFSRLLLRLYQISDWNSPKLPASIIPVTHTLELFQLANEVCDALNKQISIVSSIDINADPSIYVTSDFSYVTLLSEFDLKPTSLARQIQHMAQGIAFK